MIDITIITKDIHNSSTPDMEGLWQYWLWCFEDDTMGVNKLLDNYDPCRREQGVDFIES